MIIKYREVPLRLQKTGALFWRLKPYHPKKKRVEKDKINQESGYRGELILDKQLKYLPEKGFYILNDLRLDANPFPFQMDSIVTTQNFISIIENKDHSGELYFDYSQSQLIRKFNNIEEAFSDPIAQVLGHKRQLEIFLKKHNFPQIPINTIVTVSNYSSIIKCPDQDRQIVQEIVTRVDQVSKKITSQASLNTKKLLTPNELKRLNHLLMKEHLQPTIDILQTYNIDPTEIITGPLCPKCHSVMEFKRLTCHCSKCDFYEKNKIAFGRTANEYFLLYGDTLTNSQFRAFCNIVSENTAYRILNSLGLPYTGSNKGRVYHPR